MRSLQRLLLYTTAVVCLLAVVPCSYGSPADENSDAQGRAAIRPSIARLAPDATCEFRVVLEPRWLDAARVADNVTWAVNDVPGGNDTLGTIGADGVYHAPKSGAAPQEVHICATAKQASNSLLWATVILSSAAGPEYAPAWQWDEPADGSSHLKEPSGIAVERDGNLIICDSSKSQVFRFSPKGEKLGVIGEGGGNTRGHFDVPRSVTLDANGNIVVADMRTGPPRIQVFDRDGKLVRAFAQKGIGPGQVMQPRGMAFDPAGRLLVADADNMRVNVYAPDGALADTWQKNGIRPGEFNEPYGVVIDRNGEVCVSNYYGPCQRFSAKGAFLGAFAVPDPPKGPVAFTAAAGDQWGNAFFAVRDSAGLVQNTAAPEPKPARILKFNAAGDLVTTIPLWEDERGENAMAVDQQGRLYVLFARTGKVGVAVFQPK